MASSCRHETGVLPGLHSFDVRNLCTEAIVMLLWTDFQVDRSSQRLVHWRSFLSLDDSQ